jgi:hypothetical protein
MMISHDKWILPLSPEKIKAHQGCMLSMILIIDWMAVGK